MSRGSSFVFTAGLSGPEVIGSAPLARAPRVVRLLVQKDRRALCADVFGAAAPEVPGWHSRSSDRRCTSSEVRTHSFRDASATGTVQTRDPRRLRMLRRRESGAGSAVRRLRAPGRSRSRHCGVRARSVSRAGRAAPWIFGSRARAFGGGGAKGERGEGPSFELRIPSFSKL